jgi:hypothetical protein
MGDWLLVAAVMGLSRCLLDDPSFLSTWSALFSCMDERTHDVIFPSRMIS